MTHSPVHFIQMSVSLPGVIRHLKATGRDPAKLDEGNLVKLALNETFGQKGSDGQQIWPKPFQVVGRSHAGKATVVAYSPLSVAALLANWHPIPSLAAAVDRDDLCGYEIQALPAGSEQRFSIAFCPLLSTYGDRKAGVKSIQLDAYRLEHIRAEREGRVPRSRNDIYVDYLKSRLEKGADIKHLQAGGLSFLNVEAGANRKVSFPLATFHGTLSVTDPVEFMKVLASGIGKRKAYGCGMVLLGASAIAPKIQQAA